MKAGRLEYRLSIQKPTETVNEFGERVITWTVTATADAERVAFSGKRSDEVGEHFPDYNVRWNIYDAHEVDENWRVKDAEGHLYTVLAIEPNIRRGFKTLITARVNE